MILQASGSWLKTEPWLVATKGDTISKLNEQSFFASAIANIIICWKLSSLKTNRVIFSSQHVKAPVVPSAIWSKGAHMEELLSPLPPHLLAQNFLRNTQYCLQYLPHVHMQLHGEINIHGDTGNLNRSPLTGCLLPLPVGQHSLVFTLYHIWTGRNIVSPCFPGMQWHPH